MNACAVNIYYRNKDTAWMNDSYRKKTITLFGFTIFFSTHSKYLKKKKKYAS